METGIYQEVQAMVTDVKSKGVQAYNEGNKGDDRYYSGKLETLEVVLDKLEKHGLRYDEHGASGRRDGDDSREQQAEDGGEGLVKRNSFDMRFKELLALGIEEGIIAADEGFQLYDVIKKL